MNSVENGSAGGILFYDEATASNATIIVGSGRGVVFNDGATASNAIIINDGNSNANSLYGGSTIFYGG